MCGNTPFFIVEIVTSRPQVPGGKFSFPQEGP
jgi:hypothetical protein